MSFDDRIEDKHLMFRSYIDNNENESEFLNESFAQKRNIETLELAHENRVNLILENDISFQMLTRETHVNLLIEEHQERLFCYMIQLKCDLILKDDWLQIHNSQINWKRRIMTFSRDCIEKSCVKTEIIVEIIENHVETVDVNIQSLSSRRFWKLMNRVDNQVTCFYLKGKFNRKLERYQKKILSILKKIKSEDHDQFMKKKSKYSIDKLKKRILERYHSEIELFRRKKVDELTSHRKEYHQVNLISDFESSFIRNYKSMFEKKLQTVKHYLDEHLKKDFIRSSFFTAAISMLLIKKSEDELRFCVDYRALNEIIVKSRYLILLINATLTRLSKMKWFIKVNVVHAFNKMRIREEDEWLIAFNTR